MMAFILGLFIGSIATIAVTGIAFEMRDRKLAKSKRYKYSSSIAEVRNMRMTGMSVREISKTTGIPKSTVHRYLYVERP